MTALTFFCELDAEPLDRLGADKQHGQVVATLRQMGASVALALRDLSDQRAAFVRALNESAIPVTIWIVLAKEDGYFLHLGNCERAEARYDELRAWIARHRLEVCCIGLDFEPDLREIERFGIEPHRVLWRAAKRAWDPSSLRVARERYRALVERMRQDGFGVESYQFPALLDERRAGSSLLQRTVGVMDLPVDREVLMLYTSLAGPLGLPLLWSFAKEADAIAVGSTGGGIDSLPKLTWEALERDLLIARQYTERLYVFSLEGCAERGYLERLRGFDWSRPPPEPPVSARTADLARTGLRALLRGTSAVERLIRR